LPVHALAVALHVTLHVPPYARELIVLACGPWEGYERKVKHARSRTYLLEVGREAVHVLIVGEDGMRLGAKEVVVPVKYIIAHRVRHACHAMRSKRREEHIPNAEDGKRDGQILLNGSGAEVFIHLVSTSQQLLEVLKT
jgi:hypothetical protein